MRQAHKFLNGAMLLCLVALLPIENSFSDQQLSVATVKDARENPHFQHVASSNPDEFSTLEQQTELAKNAWALGLVNRARAIWEEILKSRAGEVNERARSGLSLAILELQEANFSKARTTAEEVAFELEPSELRGQLWLLVAEAAKAEKALAVAEKYYLKALEESSGARQAEIKFLLGQCQFEAQRLDKAKETLITIESSSPYALASLKTLTAIDFAGRNYKSVIVWITEGKSRYAEQFDSEEFRYIEIVALLEEDQLSKARNSLAEFAKTFSEESEWFILAKASVLTKVAEKELIVNKVES